MKLSVVICTYNPVEAIFHKVLQSLRSQTLSQTEWELIIVDNGSDKPIRSSFDLSWHQQCKIIIEKEAGLSYARLAGVQASECPIIVFVDDDNLLEKDYLEQVLKFHENYPYVGCFGGKSIPVFESEPPDWFFHTGINLGCQDYGNELHVSEYCKSGFKFTGYPEKAPIGTGMVITKNAFLAYVNDVKNNPHRLSLGRKGKQLTSGEDNDIILTIIKKGYEIAYVPQLIVHHLIPQKRYAQEYLKKMAYESNLSWVKVLDIHEIHYWKGVPSWSAGLRKAKSWFVQTPWRSPLHAIRWKSACGKIDGLSKIVKQ